MKAALNEQEADDLIEALYRATQIEAEYWEIDQNMIRLDAWVFTPGTWADCHEAIQKAFAQGKTPAPNALPTLDATQLGTLALTLKEAVVCLERYCGPGTRGHEVRKKARLLLEAMGIKEGA